MLAEPRRKIQYSNPRGTLWANDKQKFGQRMLESMGWKEGQGLGKNEDGITENVKASFKFDNKGLGYQHKSTDWIEDNNVYEQILSDLSKYHKISDQNQVNKNEQEPSNLESKSSNRLHYRKKFIKAKNLSMKSETDLYCIFPRSKPRAIVEPETPSKQPDNHKDEDEDVDSKETSEPSKLETVSKMSLQDYFKQKMKQIKLRQQQHESSNNERIDIQHEQQQPEEEICKKKRKKKKTEQEIIVPEPEQVYNEKTEQIQNKRPNKTKRRKRKQD